MQLCKRLDLISLSLELVDLYWPQLQQKAERNERAFELNPLTDDVTAVSSLLKVSFCFAVPASVLMVPTSYTCESYLNLFSDIHFKTGYSTPRIEVTTLTTSQEHKLICGLNCQKNIGPTIL
jgi:hypothetical protein